MSCSINRLIDERYQIVTTIGQGATGRVFLVVDLAQNRQLALKTLELNLEQQVSWGRFEREARIASRLNHPHIARVYDFGLLNQKVPYLVMELVHGQTLFDRIRTHGPLTNNETLTVFRAVASAMLYAHELNIIHRDVKPANMILTTDMHGEITGAKLIDFGLSKCTGANEFAQSLTATGEVFGSPYYMSPEHWNGEVLTASADIYSLGVALFETLSGSVPHEGANACATALLHTTEPAPYLGDLAKPPDNHYNWDLILQKMLGKTPEQRYQRVSDFSDDLNRLAAGDTIVSKVVRAKRPGCARHRPISSYSDKLLWAGISLLFLLLTSFASLLFYAFPSATSSKNTNAEFEHVPIPGITNQHHAYDVVSDISAGGLSRFYFPNMTMGKFKFGNSNISASGAVELPTQVSITFEPNELFLKKNRSRQHSRQCHHSKIWFSYALNFRH